jgi:hypothetical protein
MTRGMAFSRLTKAQKKQEIARLNQGAETAEIFRSRQPRRGGRAPVRVAPAQAGEEDVAATSEDLSEGVLEVSDGSIYVPDNTGEGEDVDDEPFEQVDEEEEALLSPTQPTARSGPTGPTPPPAPRRSPRKPTRATPTSSQRDPETPIPFKDFDWSFYKIPTNYFLPIEGEKWDSAKQRYKIMKNKCMQRGCGTVISQAISSKSGLKGHYLVSIYCSFYTL